MSSSEIQAEPSDRHQNSSGSGVPPPTRGENIVEEKKLRALMRQENVESTTVLVQTYNVSLTGETERLLRKCLRLYSTEKEQHIKPATFMEYVELCKIKPRMDNDNELLGEVVSVLTGRIPDGEFAVEGTAEALYRSLLWTPPVVFQKDITKLVALATKLTASLHPMPRLTEVNFLEHEATFMALHQVFILLQRIAGEKLVIEEKKKFQSSLKTKRSSMSVSRKYYPVQYYFKLLEQSIQRLTLEEEPSSIQRIMPYLCLVTCGLVQGFSIAGGIMRLDIDPDKLIELPGKIKSWIDNLEVPEQRWYDLLQALSFAGRKAIDDHQKLQIFEDSYKVVDEALWKMRQNDDGKALLFGLMQELRYLALSQGSDEVRRSGSSKLVALAEAVSNSAWVKDKDVVEALLSCFHIIHSRGGDAAEALRSSKQLIESAKLEVVKKAVQKWLNNKSLEDKLSDPVYVCSEPSGDLFCAIGREFNHIPLHEALENVRQLKDKYQSDDFATVPSLFDDQSNLHVKEMEHHIVFYQIVKDKKEASKQADASQSKEQSTGQRIPQPIALEDLFKKRIVKEDHPVQNIRTILFHGKPGSGKTCISKFIGYMWATGQMLKEFEAVYVLPARELNNRENSRGAPDELVAFILRKCFARGRESDKGLHAQVDDHLDLQTTLLIIDGWDEVDKKAEAILNEARNKQCSVLWLTRPYNLSSMREFTDLEVECLGFSDEQVHRYVEDEMVSRHQKERSDAQELLNTLRLTDSLWEVAHIPVMAYILCFLWNDENRDATFGRGSRQLSPASMYAHMVNYIWRRFVKKIVVEKARREDVFAKLEVIAYDALLEDLILIPQKFVEHREDSLIVQDILMHSGFLLFKKEGLDYQFPHLTFQEYFAARWLAQSVNKPVTSEENQKAQKLLQEKKYLRRYRTTLMFLAQHLAEKQGVDGLTDLLDDLDKGPAEVIGLQHLLLKLYIIEAWLVGLEDKSKIKGCCEHDAVASLIQTSILLIRDTEVNHREFGEILGRMLQQCPVLFGAVPEMLDGLTETETVRKALGYGIFGDIVKIAKGSDKHLTVLMHLAEENIQSSTPETRDVGIEMLRKLLDSVPNLVQKFMPVCNTMFVAEDPVVQDTALQAVIGLLTDKRDLFSKLLPLVKAAFKSTKSSARRMALEVIGSLSSVTTAEFKDISPMIIEGGYDNDEDVCRTVLQTMRHFISEAEFQESELIPVLERLLAKGDENVRHETIKTMEYITKKVPDMRPALVEIIEKRNPEEAEGVRRDKAELAGRLAVDLREMQEPLWPVIEKACDDKNAAAVRLAGIATVKRLAVRYSENKNEMLHLAAMGFLDANTSVRQVATEAISCIASVPHLWKNNLMLLRRACLDDDVYIRLWAVDALGRLSSVAPHAANDILEMLERTCCDADVQVRQWSMEAVGHLASAAPDLAPDILSSVNRGCSDDDEHVRLWALKAISKLAAAAPQFADNLLPLLRNAYRSEDTFVLKKVDEALSDFRSAAPYLSAHVPTRAENEDAGDATPAIRQAYASHGVTVDEFKDILKRAIEDRSPRNIQRAAFRFLDDAVTVEDLRKKGQVRVTLHTTVKTTVGEYPSEQIKEFMSEIRKTIQDSCGNLLETLEKVLKQSKTAAQTNAV